MLGLYQQDGANSYLYLLNCTLYRCHTDTNRQDIEADNVQPRQRPDFLNRQCGDVHFEECKALNDQTLSEMASELFFKISKIKGDCGAPLVSPPTPLCPTSVSLECPFKHNPGG